MVFGSNRANQKTPISGSFLVRNGRIELPTSSMSTKRSTTELIALGIAWLHVRKNNVIGSLRQPFEYAGLP